MGRIHGRKRFGYGVNLAVSELVDTQLFGRSGRDVPCEGYKISGALVKLDWIQTEFFRNRSHVS